MVVVKFPDLDTADRSGLLAVGGDLDPETLLLAYSQGIFPWPHSDDDELTWFSPPRRAVLYLDRVKIPRSLAKERKRGQFCFGINTNFEAVIDGCRSSERPGQSGTWITSEMRQAYVRFHRLGFAHSIECYAATDPDGEPVGGLYGVSIGQTFAGESMYFRTANASKMSLWFLIEQLKLRGVPWIDCQQLTPLLASFGAVTVKRTEFAAMVGEQSHKKVCLFPVTRNNSRYTF